MLLLWLVAFDRLAPLMGTENLLTLLMVVSVLCVVTQNTFEEDPMYMALMISRCLQEERKILETAQSADQVIFFHALG